MYSIQLLFWLCWNFGFVARCDSALKNMRPCPARLHWYRQEDCTHTGPSYTSIYTQYILEAHSLTYREECSKHIQLYTPSRPRYYLGTHLHTLTSSHDDIHGLLHPHSPYISLYKELPNVMQRQAFPCLQLHFHKHQMLSAAETLAV